MKLYELQVPGYHTPLTPEQIADLFRAGRLRRDDPCREVSSRTWRTLDEIFPLLKYGPDSHSFRPGVSGSPPATSALTAGWICFGLGLSISWFFPLGNGLFSVAIITAIVAMCTHEVGRGLALLISSFCAIGLCAVVFFGLVFSTAAITGAAAAQKFDRELKRSQAQQPASLASLNSTFGQLQPPLSQAPARTPRPIQNRIAPSQLLAQQSVAVKQAQDAQARNAAIRRAEQQRDAINAKEERLTQLQKSIDWYDDMIRQIRNRGGDESLFVKARDQLVKEKWDLQR